MELVELPKVEEKDDLTPFQKENLFQSIICGKDVVEKIKTSRGEFEVKFPRTRDLETIGRLAAYRLNGISEKCFDDLSLQLIREVATLDVIIRSGPAWYENAKKDSNNFTWGNIPSVKYVQEVYAKANEFRVKVQTLLDEDPDTGNKAMVAGESSGVSGSPGVFDGLSSQG